MTNEAAAELQKYKVIVELAKDLRECTAHGSACSKHIYADGCVCGLSALIDKFDAAVAVLEN